ncbi:MAG: AraC family transcriptional regulator [Spirochaetales bacterium]|nr:AraC family transcriptional regulator [Spirochaetales bacterium]
MIETKTGDFPTPEKEIIGYGDRIPHILDLTRLQPKGSWRLPPGMESPQPYQICFSSRGWQTWLVKDRYFFLPEGHFLFVKPGESLVPGDKIRPDSRAFLLRFTLPPKEDSSPLLGFTGEEQRGLFYLLHEFPVPLIRTAGEEGLMESLYRNSKEMVQGDRFRPIPDTIRVKNLLRELFLILAEGSGVFSNPLDSLIDSLLPRLPEGGYSPLVQKAIAHMSGNLYDGLTLISLADDVNISLSRFKALFKEESGLTPLEYYTRLSIQKSLELLHSTDHPLPDIADSLGFSSARYFSAVFARTVGMGPEEFRRWKEMSG